MLTVRSASAAAPLNSEPAENFFTNVAARLLRQQLGVEWTQIQIAPTNQYDRAVHRLFQLTANLYDATSTNEYPSVFRPLVTTNGGAVWLTGFTNDHRLSTLGAWLDANPHGLPLVIGAKKGFPNFNEFTLRSDVLVTRRLQLTRPNTNEFTRPNGTNQMYVLSLSNYFGVEAWNSYDVDRGAAPYPRTLQIHVTNLARASLTNSLGLQTNDVQAAAASVLIPASAWSRAMIGTNAFRLVLNTNQVFLSNAVYSFSANAFANSSTSAFEHLNGAFPIPDWTLTISNRLAYWMFEPGLDRVIDFVLLEDTQAVDLHRDFIAGVNPYTGIGGVSANIAGLWRTNRTSAGSPTEGIWRQLDIAHGNVATSAAEWREFSQTGNFNESDRQAAINSFRYFCGLAPISGVAFQTNNTLAMQTPFNPAAKLAALRTWQVNDPLVHSHRDDLRSGITTSLQFLRPTQAASNVAPSTLTYLNTRYSPWFGNPNFFFDLSWTDRRLADAGVTSSDEWNFPMNESLAPHWLGRVHRGTPWQTLYLQAGTVSWSEWLGTGNDPRTHPTNDWRTATLLAALFSTNHPRDLLSINSTNFADWQAALTGLTVLSNNLEFPVLGDPLQFETNIIASTAPQITTVVAGLEQRRLAQRDGYFTDLAAFLNTPELSSASPWLNLAYPQPAFGLTDAAYEALPGQLLARVRPDPIGRILAANNALELTFSAFDGFAFRVESSTNLCDWTTFSEPHFSTNGTFTLAVPPTFGPRYFRVVLP